MKKLDILNQTVSAARASIPTEINPEAKRPDVDVLPRDKDAERKAKMVALSRQMQKAAPLEPEPKQSALPMQEQKPEPEQSLAAVPVKQKREVKKNIPAGSIDVGVTLDLARLAQLVEELKSATTAVYIPYSIDMKLSFLSKKLRYQHKLSRQGGISNKTLACLILDDVLKNVNYD
jgi:hypothetical protein